MDKISAINYVLLPSGVLFGLVLAIGLTSMAEESELDTGTRVIPYNGVLEFNGSPLNGQADLHFTLTDVPGGEGANCLFEEEHGDVTAYTGRFEVNIGSVTGDLPDCVFDSEAMYIEVGVREAESDADYVALSGSQRIHPVPYSYWASEGSDFKVDGGLKVGGDVLAGTFADETHEGAADMRVVGGGNDRPVLWAGQFTVDSEDGSGLLNLVAGSHAIASNNYAYNSGRGSTRINLNDSQFSFYIGTDDDPAAGDTVTWAEALRLNTSGLISYGGIDVRGGIGNSDGSLAINDNLEITGTITDTNSDVVINDALDVRGALYDNGGRLELSDNVTITGNILNDNGNVDINDDLDVRHNTTIGSDGSGNLTVNGDTTISSTLRVDGQFYLPSESDITTNTDVEIEFKRIGDCSGQRGRMVVRQVGNDQDDALCVCLELGSRFDNSTQWICIEPN